jgi:hypothetical protein
MHHAAKSSSVASANALLNFPPTTPMSAWRTAPALVARLATTVPPNADTHTSEAVNGGGQGAVGGHLGGTTVVVLSASLGSVVVLAEWSRDELQAVRTTTATTAHADFTHL